ncbi:MAG: hypothetical protein AAB289_04595, partial [Chloroflexota bacterium]
SGTFSLYLNTTGGSNTASGLNALYYNTTGFYNVALGMYADFLTPAAMTTATAAVGTELGVGNYYYRVSFVIDGVETALGSYKGVTTTSGNQQVSLSGIPTYTGPRTCTARKLYRPKLGGWPTYYLLTTLNDNTTPTYTDATADASLVTLPNDPDASIMLGYGAKALKSNQLVIGDSSARITEAYVGGGIYDTAPAAVTLQTSGGSGTDIAGANLILAGGRGTGAGAGGAIIFQTAPAGGTGTAANALTETMRITSAGTVGIGTSTPSGKLDVEGGDVFIGTGTLTNTSASEDLSVTGNLEVDGILYGNGSGLTNVGGSSFGNQNANIVFAGPASGAAAAPAFRSLVDDDVSNTLTASLFVGSGSSTTAIDLATAEVGGTLPVANGGTGATTFTAGLVLANGTTAFTTTANNATNWDTAYTDRLKWDGGATGLVAATGRTSLGLGGLATLSAVGSSEITDGQVSTDDLAVDTIAAVDIAASAIGASELAAGAVTKGKVSELLATAQATPDKTVAIAAGKVYVSGNTVVTFAATNANFAAAGNCAYTPTATAKFVKALIALKNDNTLGCTLGTEQATKTAAQDEAVTYPTDRLPIAEVILKTTGTAAGDIAVIDGSDGGNSYLYADVRPHL